MGAQAERLSYDIRRGFLAQEKQFCVGGEPTDLLRDLESMQLRQVDIEQNHIRQLFFGLLNSLQPVRCFDGLKLRSSLKRRANETAERPMVLDDENPQRHLDVSSVSRRLNGLAEFTPDGNSAQTCESISATGSSALDSNDALGEGAIVARVVARSP